MFSHTHTVTEWRRGRGESYIHLCCAWTKWRQKTFFCYDVDSVSSGMRTPVSEGRKPKVKSNFTFSCPQMTAYVQHLVTVLPVCVCMRESDSPGCRVVLGPYSYVLVQVMWPQNRRVSGQVLKIVHDDSHKEIQHLERRQWRGFSVYRQPSLKSVFPSYQEGTEEDEGDKVRVGKSAATLVSCVPRCRVTLLPSQAGQHDFVPRFTSGAPAWGGGGSEYKTTAECSPLTWGVNVRRCTWRAASRPWRRSGSCCVHWWHSLCPRWVPDSQTTARTQRERSCTSWDIVSNV